MSESLVLLLDRAKLACAATARHCRNRAATTTDTLVGAALVGFAGQLDGRVAQIDAWLLEVDDGVTPKREAEMRASCAEWLRMGR